MLPSFIEGLIAGYGIAIPVGAIAILIFSISLRCGFRIGFMAGAGAATADVFYALLAILAGVALTTLLHPLAAWLRLVSGLVLIGLAASGLWQGLRPSRASSKTAEVCAPWPMYTQFVGLTLINPLTVIYFTAFILGRDPATAPLSLIAQVLFVVGVGLASLSWQTLLVGLGSLAQRHLSPRFQVSAIVAGNLLVLGLGLRILVRSVLSGL